MTIGSAAHPWLTPLLSAGIDRDRIGASGASARREGHLLSPAAEREAYDAQARAKLAVTTQVSGGGKGRMTYISAGR